MGGRLTFAIADLHGRRDLLAEALARIAEHAAGRPYRIVTLGDYIDRGPESRQVIETLMALQADPARGFDLVCLKGNHEDMMVETLNSPLDMGWWLGNGGEATLRSYPSRQVPAAHVEWCRSLPSIWIDGKRVFVHADFDETKLVGEQTEARLLWSRRAKEADLHSSAGYVVHGHTPFPDGPVILFGRCNLDTLAWRTGRLCIAVFDDDRTGGPIDILDVTLAGRQALKEQTPDAALRAIHEQQGG